MTRYARGYALALIVGVLVACGGSDASPSPAPTPTPSPAPATEVSNAAQAAALVFASDDRFARMQPLRSDAIGQSAWYEASEDGDGYVVKVTLGAGDCQAGCIERHTWTYRVDPGATVNLVGEEGDAITFEPAPPTADQVILTISLIAGPVCPVEHNPPDPACAPRPVANAGVEVFDAAERRVGQGVSGDDGTVAMQLPTGAYFVVPEPVEGLMGQAAAQAFAAVGGDQVGLLFTYDTGIR